MRTPIFDGPPPRGPYTPVIVAAGPMAFVSGQLPIDPATGELLRASFREQAELVFANVTRLLRAAGTDWPHVVKLSVFLADLGDFAGLNEIARRFVVEPYPARTTIQAVLPPGVGLELDCVALVPTA